MNEQITRYLAGRMSDAERRAFEAAVLEDAELANALYADINEMEAMAAATRHRPERTAWWRRAWVRILVPIAAATALLLVLVGPPAEERAPRVLRGGPIAIEGMSPRGELEAAPDRFEWTPVPEAERYHVELFDEASRLRFDAFTIEPRLALPAAAFGEETRFFWRVTPIGADDELFDPSPPAHFHIR